MSKIKLGSKNLMLPFLPVLVGTKVEGKPNYITIALIGWLCYDAISVSVGREQYSNAGIKENGTFSVNQPSASMVKKLDYCGLYSGRKVDKSTLFENFYGKLKTAPMIKECPINIECRLVQTMERRVHTVFIGEVVEVYFDQNCLTEGVPDVSKVNPILYGPVKGRTKHSGQYWKLGDPMAKAWKIGKELFEKKLSENKSGS
jgi:flavin reductase (DIM6/NTAB) family NADH-FMN oxidoreductase RutF